MRDERVTDNLLYTEIAGVGKYSCFFRRPYLTVLEQFEIVLFSVREVDCKNLGVFLVHDDLRLDRVPLLLAGIVVFLAVFTVFCLFFSVALSGSQTRPRGSFRWDHRS